MRESSEAAANALKRKEAGGKVTLTFYEKGMWGDKVPWEEWVMHFVVRTEPSFGHRSARFLLLLPSPPSSPPRQRPRAWLEGEGDADGGH